MSWDCDSNIETTRGEMMSEELENIMNDVHIACTTEYNHKEMSFADKVGLYRVIRKNITDCYNMQKGDYREYYKMYRGRT